MKFKFNDGGRSKYFRGAAGDCVTRAIAIASGSDYLEVYRALADGNLKERKSRGCRTARNGVRVNRKWFKNYMTELGFKWYPCMSIGRGCMVHLRDGELPDGNLVVQVSKHYVAVINGVINDTYDCSRNETRCVYGFWKFQK